MGTIVSYFKQMFLSGVTNPREQSVGVSSQDAFESAVYVGTLEHCRLAPKRHRFMYDVFMMYLDLDEVDAVLSTSYFWSAKGFNLAWFRRKDFIGSPDKSIHQSVVDVIAAETGDVFSGSIRVLTNLRYFGFIINPISCYYCFGENNKLRYVVLEVTNTPWREKCRYVIPCDPESNVQRTTFEKSMHVSPFFPMDMTYHWMSHTPGKVLNITLSNWQEDSKVFFANLALQRRPIARGFLSKTILIYPFMTLKVFLGIYWQALRLFLKGVRFVPHPER